MKNKEVLEIIKNFSPGKKNYEGKKATKLGFYSLYDYISHKIIEPISPSQQQISKLLEEYQNNKYIEAEKLALIITQQFPEYQFGWKVLGAVLGQIGKNYEAINANQRALQLVPKDNETHSNLGMMLQEMGRLEEAEGC